MNYAELEDFANAPTRTYSSGMLARLGFAVATLFRPDILVLDEVLAVGDAGFQEKSSQRILDFVQQGSAVILASHDLHAFEQMCERIAWLDQGHLRALGPPGEVLPQYLAAIAEHAATP
jgi:ABC-type polysaccharide/polyol phosphate transport system ATPase subunit